MTVLAAHPTRYALGVHEAGHAVLLAVFGLWFSTVDIGYDPRTETLGRINVTDAERAAMHARPLQYAMAAVAGTLAEAMLGDRDLPTIADTCGERDFALADELCQGMDPGAGAVLIARASRQVERNFRAIHAVAADLVVYERLSADEVAAVVSRYPASTAAVSNTSPGGPR